MVILVRGIEDYSVGRRFFSHPFSASDLVVASQLFSKREGCRKTIIYNMHCPLLSQVWES